MNRFWIESLAALFLVLIIVPGVPGAPGAAAQPDASASADTIKVDVHEAVVMSLRISPEVRAEAAGADFARARYDLARASRYLTTFSARSAHSTSPAIENPNGTSDERLYLDPDVRNDWERLGMFNRIEFEAVQPIYTWGELGGNIRAARAAIDIEKAGMHGKRIEVASRTAQLYYALLLTESLVRITEEAGDILDRAKDEIQRLLDEGAEDVDDADLYQVQIEEQKFKSQVVEIEQRRLTARAALRRQLFLSDSTFVEVDEAVLEPIDIQLKMLREYQDEALRNRTEIMQAEAGRTARKALVDVARSDYYPKLFIGATATYAYAPNRVRLRNPYVGDSFLSRGVEAGIGVRQKLNFGQTKARVEQARAEAAQVRYQGEAARQLVLFEVEEAYRNVLIKKKAVETRGEALRISKTWLRNEQVNFEFDLGDTENLVKAVRENLDLQAEEYRAIFEYNRAVIELWETTGRADRMADSGMLVE